MRINYAYVAYMTSRYTKMSSVTQRTSHFIHLTSISNTKVLRSRDFSHSGIIGTCDLSKKDQTPRVAHQ